MSLLKTGVASCFRVGRLSRNSGGVLCASTPSTRCRPESLSFASFPGLFRSGRRFLSTEEPRPLDGRRKVVIVPGATPHREFLAETSTSFESLGIDTAVADALLRAGFERPAKVQAIGVPKIAEGKDVLVAAETGSGKTITYLAPLLSKLVQQKRKADEENKSVRAIRSFAVVLCPNGTLCNQVKSVADALTTPDGTSLATTMMVYQAMTEASRRPDVVVATPAGLLSTLRDLDKDFAMDWIAGVGHLVVDEADMLMTGGYCSKLQKIVELFRIDERNTAYDYLSYALGMSEDEVGALPRHLKRAAVKGGIQQMLEEGFQPEQEAAKNAIEQFKAKGNRPEGRPPWHRQYIFVAATVPSEAKKNVATDIRSVCPDIEWVTSSGLHKTISTVDHQWVDVSESDPRIALFRALEDSGGGRTLVFAKDSIAAGQIQELISSRGVDAVLYHSKLRHDDAQKSLQMFRTNPDKIMVCTDAASRGLDVPNVTHVIQADFASSAIDFLHRVGRTGRAGAEGKVTSLFSKENRDLVEAIKLSMSQGVPIEGAFSRKRSFRKKFKRYGKYVPRGQTVNIEATG
ncbi:hypothetical protein BSKO_06651 [Bryopsis sp. KO-2023]|nr:hypothetical protein BSKO_06651 [Bryopsis sp. KO-2023]